MRIIRRPIGKTVFINEDISLTVVSIKKNKVTFGINAPRKIKIYDDEAQQKLAREAVENLAEKQSE